MIITIGGTPGSGKSTIAKKVAEKLQMKQYSIGDFMRQLASERNMSILEISSLAEKDKAIDEELDNKQMELAKQEDNFVIDSRLGWHFIPNSLKVFLSVSDEEGGKRIYESQRKHEVENITLRQTIQNTKKRRASEKERYSKFYNLDADDKENYDLVIDTAHLTPEEVVDIIVKAL